MNDYFEDDMTTEDGSPDLDKALAFAKQAHAGQTRKLGVDKGKPYVIHPFRVFQLILNKGIIDGLEVIGPVALLHDSIEDGYINGVKVTKQTLLDAGFSKEVTDTVSALSRDKENETYFDFIMRIKKYPYARIVKLADLEDNMRDLEESSLKDKYRFAKYVLENR